MKALRIILRAIHNLPEEARRLLAGFFLLIAAILLFNNWATSVSSDLTLEKISAAQQMATPEKTAGAKPGSEISAGSVRSLEATAEILLPGKKETGSESAPAMPAPLESIASSIKSLEKLIKSPPANSGETEVNIKQKINNLTASLYGGLEKIWKYVYEPLKK